MSNIWCLTKCSTWACLVIPKPVCALRFKYPTLKDLLIKLDIIYLFELEEGSLDFRTLSVFGGEGRSLTTLAGWRLSSFPSILRLPEGLRLREFLLELTVILSSSTTLFLVLPKRSDCSASEKLTLSLIGLKTSLSASGCPASEFIFIQILSFEGGVVFGDL